MLYWIKHGCQMLYQLQPHTLRCSVFCLLLFNKYKNKTIPWNICMHRVPSCEWKMPDTKTLLLSPCAYWHKDDGEKNKASTPLHTLFSLACYESITNPFIACSRRIALRDNALKGYHAAADAQLQCGSASLDEASTSWVHWHQLSGDGHGIRAV